MPFTNKVIDSTEEEQREEVGKASEKKTDIAVKDGEEARPPFSAYSEIYKMPYTARYFNIDYFNVLDDKTDVEKIRPKVKNIEDFISEEIKLRKMDDNINSYKELINKVLEVIGDSQKDVNLLARVSKYINMIQDKRANDKKFKKMLKDTGMSYFMNIGANNG
jgi:hypothetical protein